MNVFSKKIKKIISALNLMFSRAAQTVLAGRVFETVDDDKREGAIRKSLFYPKTFFCHSPSNPNEMSHLRRDNELGFKPVSRLRHCCFQVKLKLNCDTPFTHAENACVFRATTAKPRLVTKVKTQRIAF